LSDLPGNFSILSFPRTNFLFHWSFLWFVSLFSFIEFSSPFPGLRFSLFLHF
jgi:hypothetical protein